MAANTYDVIVLGLGVMGSAAAYHLANDGQKVLALEQFELDHRLGSSYGESRIIRYTYDRLTYVEMSKFAYPMWRELEQVSGRSLMHTTGGLDFGPPDYPTFVATQQNLDTAGIPYEKLSRADVSRRFPQFNLDEGMAATYQPDSAYLAASLCVITQAELAAKRGATLLTKTPVTQIEPLRDSVRVHTADAQYEAGKLVLTGGPWNGKLLASLGLNLPLQPTHEELVFFEPLDKGLFEAGNCPVFIYHHRPWYYGIPSVVGTGLKVSVHGRNIPTDPYNVRRTPDGQYVQHVREWVQHYIPRGAGKVKESRVCLYTMTPDEHFIIDRHPAYPQVVFGAGFSGHGFKFGIFIGRLLADLAVRGETEFDIALFSAKRFTS